MKKGSYLSLEERFRRKYSVDPATECWITIQLHPYGTINYRTPNNESKCMCMHHAAYILYKGEIPAGLWVLHTCNNNRCCNPNHLYLGDRQQNEKDKALSGVMKGSNHPRSKLNDSQVSSIRKRFQEGFRDQELANEFGVTKGAISKIRNNRTWTHIESV